MKNLNFCFCFCFLCIMLSGCKKEPVNEHEPVITEQSTLREEIVQPKQTVEPTLNLWKVEVLNVQVAESLSVTQSLTQYNGTVLEVPQNDAPKQGYLFLLMNLLVEKQGPGKSTFSWKNAYVIDDSGQKYYRHENDSFLEVQKFKRLKATDITLGKNEGYVCYEIPYDVVQNDLWFVYEGDGDDKTIKIELER